MESEQGITIFYQDWDDSICHLITFEKKGSIRMSFDKDIKRATLSDLYVDNYHRKSGIASKLLKTAEDLAKERGLVFVQLQCNLKKAELLSFYLKRGYQYSAESARENYIWLQKTLIV